MAVLPFASFAVTVTLPATPAVAGDGKPFTVSEVAGPGVLVSENVALCPFAAAVTVYGPPATVFAVAMIVAIPPVVVVAPLLGRLAVAPPAVVAVKVTAVPSATVLPYWSCTVTLRDRVVVTGTFCGVAGVGVSDAGGPGLTVKVTPLEVPPPGVRLTTVTVTLPTVLRSAVGITAVSWVGETKVVDRVFAPK